MSSSSRSSSSRSSSSRSSSSRSSSSMSSSDSSSTTSVVSILDRLKAARPSKLSRKRKVGINPPPKRKRTCRAHRGTVSEPKSVNLAQRVKETETKHSRSRMDSSFTALAARS